MTDLTRIPPDLLRLLPPSIKLLVQGTSMECAVAVVKAFGGRPLYIPAAPSQALIDAIGAEHAQALCRYSPNVMWSQVPACKKAVIVARDAVWLAEHEQQGKSQVQIAAESGLTWLGVHKAIGRAREARPPEAGPPEAGPPEAGDDPQMGFDF
jgi:hypothetical protein